VTESFAAGSSRTCGTKVNGTSCLWYDQAYVSSFPFRSCMVLYANAPQQTAYTVQVANKDIIGDECSTQPMGP
jgi:hypothetical protein